MDDPSPTSSDPGTQTVDSPADTPPKTTPPDPAAAPSPQRPRRWWIWLVAIVVVAAVGVGGVFAYRWSQEQALKRAQVQAAVDTEAHWAAAAQQLDAIKTIQADLPKIGSESASSSVTGWVSTLDTMKVKAAPELAAAKTTAERLAPGPVRTAYLAAIQDGDLALDNAVGSRTALGKLPFFYQKTGALKDAIDRAATNVNDSVAAGNKEKDSAAATEARRALKDLALADRIVGEMRAAIAADKSLGDAGLADATRVIKWQRSLANYSLTISKYLSAGSIDKANSVITKYNRSSDQADQYTDPDFFGDPSAFGNTPIADLRHATELWDAAKSYHETALRESMKLPR